jgi:parallel beta-helix repeat protein
MRRNRFVLVLATCLLSIALFASPSSAKECGGDIACACGDTVRGVAVLQSDLGVCPGLGLGVTTGSVLDCAGHTVTGSGIPGAWYGIELDSVSGAQVRNCRVTAFRRGLRISGGGGHWLVGNEVFETGNYGIDLADATAGNRIESNVIRRSGDEGIHVGTGASDNAIVGNEIVDSKAENVYLLAASGTRLIGNVVVHTRNNGAAIFIKHSVNTYVADNVVFDNPIQVRGGSRDNVFEDNALRGDGYVFEAYSDNNGLTYPQRNQVTEGTVFNAERCVQLAGAYDTLVHGVTAGNCTLAAVTEDPVGLEPPFRNDIDLTMKDPEWSEARAAVQVSTTSRTLHAGDVLSVGLAVHNGPTNVELDLYVGLFLPDNQIAFFAGSGPAGLRLPPAAPTPMQRLSQGSSVTLPRFLEVALPPGVPSGTYQFFAALVKPGALSDGFVDGSELAGFDLEEFTIAP